MGAKKSLEAANADLEMQYDVLSKNFADAGKNYKKLQASFKDLQDENDAAGVAYSELKDQYAANEHKYGLLFADYEEIKGTLDANDRTRKAAADELANLTDAYQTLTAQNAALSSAKRKLESEHEVMHNDWEDATAAAKSAEDAAKKALADAAKLSEDWKAQGNTIAALEKLMKTQRTTPECKNLSASCKENSSNTNCNLKRPKLLPTTPKIIYSSHTSHSPFINAPRGKYDQCSVVHGLTYGEWSILIILNYLTLSPIESKELNKWYIYQVQTTFSNRLDLLSWFNKSLVNSR